MKYIKGGLILFISLFIFTNSVYSSSADTLAGLRAELSKLKQDKSNNDYKLAKTREEINAAKNNIYSSQNEIIKNQDSIDKAKIEIEKLNVEIAKTEENIKGLMNAIQHTQGNNIYLEYILDAKDYADLVYRYAIIEQVAKDNKEKINSWENKIDQNKQLQIELAEREKELKVLIEKLNKSVASLGTTESKYEDVVMDIKDEINSTQEYINYLVKLGCGENQNIASCINMKGDTGFLNPIVKGTITSPFGYRVHPITGAKGSYHNAIDISGPSFNGTKVYSAANGKVSKIIYKSSCGGNEVYVHHNISGKLYTTAYYHLLTINVSLGDNVTSNTVIGTAGGSKSTTPWDYCSTGAHLHFVIANGWYGTSCSGDCYLSFDTFKYIKSIDPQKVLGLPNEGIYWYSR